MPRRRRRPPLTVYMDGRRIGRLSRAASGAIDFAYDGAWLDEARATPVSLSLPLREDRYIGDPVFAVFDNLLPDSQPIRRRVADRVGADGTDAFSLLTAVGRDCVGALQFVPDDEEPSPVGAIDGARMEDDDIARMLGDLASAPLGLGEDADFRISVAGAQEKTALLFWHGGWYRPHGTTATTHILKPQIGTSPNGMDLTRSVENEYLCLKLTEALGIPSAAVEMTDFADQRTLVVERFDRRWADDGRLLRRPQEDFCQALSCLPSRKYQADGGPGTVAILDRLLGSDSAAADRALFLRAQVVFWLLAATDGHAKNFSIHLLPGGRFRMAPLYDVISAQPSIDAGQIQQKAAKLAMSVGDGRHYRIGDIVPRHFVESAARGGLGEAVTRALFDDLIATAPDAIAKVRAALPAHFPVDLLDSVVAGFERRLARLARA